MRVQLSIADTLTCRELEHVARERFNQRAAVFPIVNRFNDAVAWWCLAVGGEVIGFRRTLAEMPALIQHAPRDGQTSKEISPAALFDIPTIAHVSERKRRRGQGLF